MTGKAPSPHITVLSYVRSAGATGLVRRTFSKTPVDLVVEATSTMCVLRTGGPLFVIAEDLPTLELELTRRPFARGILLTIHYETDLKGVQQGRYPFRSAVLNQFDLNCSSNLYKLVIAELAPQGPATLSSKRIHPAVTVIGSSTGGPRALTELLGSIGGPPHTPILIVQHIASQFSNNLVRDLTRTSPFPVREAVNHQAIERGVAYIAPGGYHMRVKRESGSPRIFLDTAPPINAVRPSVDCLFESAAEVYGAKVLGIILTGMGNDGAQGLKRIKEAGGIACVQDEKSCAVYGMPRAAIESKVVDYVLTLPQLAKVIREQATP